VLTGEGTSKGAAAGDEEGKDEEDSLDGYKDTSIETVYSTMSNFANKIEELKDDAVVKEKAAALMRDFVVLVAYTRFCPKT